MKRVLKRKSEKRRNKFIIFSALGVIGLLGASLGIFGSSLNINDTSKTNHLAVENSLSLPSEGSLSKYWDNLKTSSLLDSSTSLSNFINENGAVFESLIASKTYQATAALNEVVSTPKQIGLTSDAQGRTNLGNHFKQVIRKQSGILKDWLTKDIESADDYIARLESIKKIYPHFHKTFLREQAQNYGIWVRKSYKSPSDFATALPEAANDELRDINTVFLRSNYKEDFTNDVVTPYSTALYKMYQLASVQQLGIHAATIGSQNDNGWTVNFWDPPSVGGYSEFLTGKLWSTSFLLGDNEENAYKLIKGTKDKGKSLGVEYNNKLHKWAKYMRCSFYFIASLVCGPIAYTLTPKDWPIDGPWDTKERWLNSKIFEPNKLVKYAAYPYADDSADGLHKNLALEAHDIPYARTPSDVKDDYDGEVQDYLASLRRSFEDSEVKGWGKSPTAYWREALEQSKTNAASANLENGSNRGAADIEFLSNVYFDKIAKEWQNQANEIKSSSSVDGVDGKYLYFDSILDTGRDSVVDLMKGDMIGSIWNKAISKYLVEIEKQVRDAVIKYGKIKSGQAYKAKTNKSPTSWGAYHKMSDGTDYNLRFSFGAAHGSLVDLLKQNSNDVGKLFSYLKSSANADNDVSLASYANYLSKYVKPILSEENKRAILKKYIDKAWEENADVLNRRIKEKLLANKKNALTEFEKLKQVAKEYLEDAFDDTHLKIASPRVNNVGEKSIPNKVGGELVNFAYIPEGNLAIDPLGNRDPRAEDVLDRFLTKNLSLASLLRKDNPVGEALSSKSIIAQKEFITSYFAVLRRDVFDKLSPVLNKFSEETEDLLNGYLELAQYSLDRRYRAWEVSKHFAERMFPLQKLNEKIIEAKIQNVKLAEGFLLDIVDVPRLSDPENKFATLWEMMEKDEDLNNYFKETQLTLISQG